MISVQLDATQAIARFGQRGLPVTVRNNLRRVLPDLTKRLGDQVSANLDAGLKSRRRLVVRKEMVENPTQIYGTVTTVSTSPPIMLPLWLEDGTLPHIIRAKNVSALYFFWDKLGKFVSFKQVMHPGFAGIRYTQNAFDAMEDEIKRTIDRIVREGLGTRF